MTYVFITNCGLNVYILEIVLDILDKLFHDSLNLCGCLTLNEMHIDLASLIICICLIKCNLTHTSSISPPTVKNSIIYSKFNNFVYVKRNFTFIESLRITLTCFKHQINIAVVLLFCGSFFQYYSGLVGKWSI